MPPSSDSSNPPTPSENSHLSIDTSFLVNDKWKIESKIGSGGSGTVYTAKDVESGDPVAVKLEHRQEGLLRNERAIYQHLGCFSESCRAFGLSRIHFYGEYGPDHLALVMDCLGPSLETFTESNKKMDQEMFSMTAMKALDILQFVHSQGVVHVDVWAGNLLRGRNDSEALYLVDFGIADICGRSRRFKKLCIVDLQDLGKALFELGTGREYIDVQFSKDLFQNWIDISKFSSRISKGIELTIPHCGDFLLGHRRSEIQS